MCGLVAIINWESGGFNNKELDLFKSMLVANSLRGAHSTGVVGIDKHTKEGDIVKAKGSPFMLFSAPGFGKWEGRMYQRYSAVIGHGRYATKGDHTAENAHPFYENGWFLVHNGFISNEWSLKNRFELEEAKVDSHLATKLIAKIGIKEAMEKFAGAMAFIAYDTNEKKIYAVRNKERSLYIGQLKNRPIILIASEWQNLHFCTSRLGLDLKPVDGDKFIAEQIPEDTLLTFDLENPKLNIKEEPIPVSTDCFVKGQRQNWKENTEFSYFPTRDLPERKNKDNSLKLIENKKIKHTCRLKIGSRIHFRPISSQTLLPDAKDKQEKTYIEGMFNDFEVHCFVYGDFTQFLDADLLSGDIIKFFRVPTKDGRSVMRIILENITKEKFVTSRTIPAIEQAKPDDDLKLFDNSTIKRHRYRDLAAKHCVKCGGFIFEYQAEMVMGSHREDETKEYGLACPQCTLTLITKH